jgi:hypothetical protein
MSQGLVGFSTERHLRHIYSPQGNALLYLSKLDRGFCVNHVLIQYSYLQMLDLLTTVAFLLNGVQEGNPMVRFFFGLTRSPLGGLVLVKGLALLLGLYCWRMGRGRLLTRINWLFAAIVAWNLLALIVGSLHRAA